MVLFGSTEEASTDNGLHHQIPDDTNSHNNDQHNLHRPLDSDNNLETSKQEPFNNDAQEVSALNNLQFEANQFFLADQQNTNSKSSIQNPPALDSVNKFDTFEDNYDISSFENLGFEAEKLSNQENTKNNGPNQPFGFDNNFETLNSIANVDYDHVSAFENQEFEVNKIFLNNPENSNRKNKNLGNNFQTRNPKTLNSDDDVSTLENLNFDANDIFRGGQTGNTESKTENQEAGLVVSQENQLLTSNSFKTFPLIQDNSASSFPRIPDGPIDIHNGEHNRMTITRNMKDQGTSFDINGVDSNDQRDVKSSRLQSQDDRSDYYSHGQTVDDSGVSDGDSVILQLHDTKKELPTSQYQEVIISPHLGIQSEPGTNPNSISNTALPVADYASSPYSRQNHQTKQKYFPAKEIDAIPPGLSEITGGHRDPHRDPPVGNAIAVENLNSLDTSRGRGGGKTGLTPATDQFRPPTSLLYGFKPMTTTESVASSGASRPINYHKQTLQVQSDSPVKYKPSYKPIRKPKNFVLETISSLLRPITQTITNLFRGWIRIRLNEKKWEEIVDLCYV